MSTLTHPTVTCTTIRKTNSFVQNKSDKNNNNNNNNDDDDDDNNNNDDINNNNSNNNNNNDNNNVFETFKTFTSLDMKRKGVADFRATISQTFFTITKLIDFMNTEI